VAVVRQAAFFLLHRGLKQSSRGTNLSSSVCGGAAISWTCRRPNDKLNQVESRLINATNEKMVTGTAIWAELDQMRERLLRGIRRLNCCMCNRKKVVREGERGGTSGVGLRRKKLRFRRWRIAEASRDSRDIKSVEGALQRAEKRLNSEMARVKQVEERQEIWVKERDKALDSSNASQDQVRTLTETLRISRLAIDYLEAQEK